jgi:hypothetical protein
MQFFYLLCSHCIIRHFTGNFENEIPESGTTISGFADNKNKKKNPDQP